MKIAFVGKGGSGKSSTSWLIITTLESLGKKTLAIDADHNMALTSNLGLNPEITPLMHTTEEEFMARSGLMACCGEGALKEHHHTSLPSFSITPMDDYTQSISTKISPTLSLINIGLGSPEVLFQSKCSHGLSGPLKYYLGLLDEKDGYVVIDSVAGADMLNYGLYAGIDAVIGIVEPHRNSVKVFEQIQNICRKTMIPCFAVINKPVDNEFYRDFIARYATIILGEIPFDPSILDYDYTALRHSTKESAVAIIEKISKLSKRGNLNSGKEFDTPQGA